MTEFYSLVYRSAVTGELTGEVFSDKAVLDMVVATSRSLMQGGHYMVFKGDFSEVTV